MELHKRFIELKSVNLETIPMTDLQEDIDLAFDEMDKSRDNDIEQGIREKEGSEFTQKMKKIYFKLIGIYNRRANTKIYKENV